jgi:selenoprotein W-related protein
MVPRPLPAVPAARGGRLTVPPARPRLEIEYCTRCRWLLRAAWIAQELLTTFEAELGEVALRPGSGGAFEIRVDGETMWSRQADGGFPDLPELKRLVRGRVPRQAPRAL